MSDDDTSTDSAPDNTHTTDARPSFDGQEIMAGEGSDDSSSNEDE
jgi:hypothetical protein